ncbi:unnamed protein product [Heligmosomoides polygyrus]|uniref:Uncharacterized protein n=1 Tax=Heligmosomoides polygyrus TaxID=6339 RepID=A0A183FS71_HELPZ|nr:unnamed protein product [Heligmosomoides polygyrus]
MHYMSSPVPSGASAVDYKKMLYRPALLLQYRSARSANKFLRFLQETMKEQAPSRATCLNLLACNFDNGDKPLEDSRRTGRPHAQNSQLVLAT